MKNKKYPIGGFAPGNYTCKCVSCKENFMGDKRAVQCEDCATKEDKPFYQPEITQSRAGFNLAEELFKPKWISVETPPDDERNVIIKTFDYRKPKENVTDTTLGYFENGHWFYDSGGHVNDGNGWHIIQWMEIPQ